MQVGPGFQMIDFPSMSTTNDVYFLFSLLGQTRTFVVRGGVWVDITTGFRRTGFAMADEVKAVLTQRFCGVVSGSTCSIQSLEFTVSKTICSCCCCSTVLANSNVT